MIRDSVFLIIGGISPLGMAITEKLLAEGARIAFCDTPEMDVKNFGDDKIIFLPMNVLVENEVRTVLDMILQKFGRLDGIVNCLNDSVNAPIYDFKNKEPHSLQEFTKIITINTIGPFNVIRLALGLMARNEPNDNGERGIIINTYRFYAGETGMCAYNASKTALTGLTLTLDEELKSKRIRVVTLPAGPSSLPEEPNVAQFFMDKFTNHSSSFSATNVAHFVKLVIESPTLRSNVVNNYKQCI